MGEWLAGVAAVVRLEIAMPGLTEYGRAWAWQKQRVARLQRDPSLPDGLLLLTHPPVYTLGEGSDPRFLKFDPQQVEGYSLYRVERGGEVTYHGPGQWVGYPILNLRRHRQDLHWYLRQLEEVVLDVLGGLGLRGEREAGLTGVWLEGVKVAAIGIRVTRWITFHGFALNVCPDLSAYQRIVACGLSDRVTGSLAQFCPDIEMERVGSLIVQAFCRQFDLDPYLVGMADWLDGRDPIPQEQICSS
ncbi:MAG: lipoyl(octanoyl) transferase LipB [Cyanobacteriota bacterium]|nr:lipoyl(octanoyl) transferase LipB [Cyanobacteriota bacterium]